MEIEDTNTGNPVIFFGVGVAVAIFYDMYD